MLNFIPFPIGSIVKFENTLYLIQEIALCDLSYVLVGHLKLNSAEMGFAWANHSDLTLVNFPSINSWTMLLEVAD